MLLYKYLANGRLDVLTRRRLRLTPAAAFNDPFDSFPLLGAFADEAVAAEAAGAVVDGLLALRRNRKPDQVSPSPASPQVSVIEAFAPLLRDYLRLKLSSPMEERDELAAVFRREFIDQHGIVCFSETADNVLMWSHYASQHGGIVIGIESDSSVFRCDMDFRRVRRLLERVSYSHLRPQITLATAKGDMDAAMRIIRQSLLTKSHHWAYEKEWRLIGHLDSADERELSDQGDPLHFVSIPPEALAEVICGCRMSAELLTQIENALSIPELAHVKLRRSRMDSRTYDLMIE